MRDARGEASEEGDEEDEEKESTMKDERTSQVIGPLRLEPTADGWRIGFTTSRGEFYIVKDLPQEEPPSKESGVERRLASLERQVAALCDKLGKVCVALEKR